MNSKKSKVQRTSKETGITLIALVITIIVLIILAVVAINMAFGDNGLIKRAEEAGDYYANDTAYTDESIANVDSYISGVLGKYDATEQEPTPIANLENKDEKEEYTLKVVDDNADGEEEIFYIPGGFKLGGLNAEGDLEVTTEVDEGIVITDGTNEFVWVPVDSTSLSEMYQTESTDTVTLPVELSKSSLNEETTTTGAYSKLRFNNTYSTSGAPGSTGYREPDILTSTTYGDAVTGNDERGINLIKSTFGYTDSTDAGVLKHFAQDMVNEYNATYESIKKYGGFYIGRYELTETENEEGEKKPTVQRDQPVLTAANENYTTWYGLKKACNEVVTNSQYVQSEMIYGNQWDEVMDWLKQTKFASDPTLVDSNSSSWGNYRDYNSANGYEEGNEKYVAEAGTLQESGFSDYWSANNIYDLAGNYYDWTQEAYDAGSRVLRRWLLRRFWF